MALRKPVRIVQKHTNLVRGIALDLTGDEHPELYVTDTTCGRFFCKRLTGEYNVTIPLWAVERGLEYCTYYVAHELAHLYDYLDGRTRLYHDDIFYKWFFAICPKEYQHYELEYLPKLASAAGITKPQE